MARTIAIIMIFGMMMVSACNFPGGLGSQQTAVVDRPVETVGVPNETPLRLTATPETSPSPEETPLTPTPEIERPTATTEVELPVVWIAFIGTDGNLWLLDKDSGERQQITNDSLPWQDSDGSEVVITYCCAQWSSDGDLLAFRREVGTPVPSGFELDYSLWVFDANTQESRPVLEDLAVSGFAWKPGTRQIAYGLPVPEGYFLDQSTENISGIWELDIDTGETSELVSPERGFPLVAPVWTQNGSYLSFEEVIAMEGRGQFAYFNFGAQSYTPWNEVIGSYSWAPDGEIIAYDRLAYVPTGDERILLRDRTVGAERGIGVDYDPGYAFNPLISPRGDKLAHLAALSAVEDTTYTLFVMDFPGGEPQSFGEFEQASDLAWSPDGDWLVLTAGPFEARQIFEINPGDGSPRAITEGSQPVVQPRVLSSR